MFTFVFSEKCRSAKLTFEILLIIAVSGCKQCKHQQDTRFVVF